MPKLHSVLVIDDNSLIHKIIKKTLPDDEFEIIGYAENGFQGIDLYKTLKPDLVTLDVTMPELSGLDTLKGLQEIDPNVKVVFLTSTNSGTAIDSLHQMGMQHFVLKPFKTDELLETLRKVCM